MTTDAFNKLQPSEIICNNETLEIYSIHSVGFPSGTRKISAGTLIGCLEWITINIEECEKYSLYGTPDFPDKAEIKLLRAELNNLKDFVYSRLK